MNSHMTEIAQACLAGAETSEMTFPQIVGVLMQAGFEGYAIDFRRATATYYTPDGDCVVLPTHRVEAPVSPAFDTDAIRSAIRDAQQLAVGYTYAGFCTRVAAAGCAGYIVSFLGKRVVYFGRSAEVHTEHFPPAP
jgi:uncharacterized protein YbcV (DUF1398 family)